MKARAELKLRSGDTVRVWQKVVEKGKTRRQAFEGLVLAVKHGTEPGATFTVRKVSLGVGVEKIFPLYSPMIESIEVLRRADTRRSKLYFIREKASRDQKRAMRKSVQVSLSSTQLEAEDVVPAADVEPVEAEVPTQEDLTNEAPEVSAETTDTPESAE